MMSRYLWRPRLPSFFGPTSNEEGYREQVRRFFLSDSVGEAIWFLPVNCHLYLSSKFLNATSHRCVITASPTRNCLCPISVCSNRQNWQMPKLRILGIAINTSEKNSGCVLAIESALTIVPDPSFNTFIWALPFFVVAPTLFRTGNVVTGSGVQPFLIS